MGMIYSIDFLELTEKINPFAFVKYLKDTGWTYYPTKKDYIRVFQLERGDNFYNPYGKDSARLPRGNV